MLMELIPGLPDDVARECLIRVPYSGFPAIASTCMAWRAEIKVPGFRLHRKAAGHGQTVVVMAQAIADPARKSGFSKIFHAPVYRLVAFEPLSGVWSKLSPPPEFSDGLPMFCRLAAAGSNLVVVGGLDPVSWEASSSVYIFNFITAEWRRGVDMPGVRRSFFGCSSDGNNLIFVAGGHDTEKRALRSALAYDVDRDQWLSLPGMARERDECKGIFHLGKFWAIGGYRTELQGKFEKSCEEFDVASWQWGSPLEDALVSSTCPRTCVEGDADDYLYMCTGSDVLALRGSTWHAVAKIPDGVDNPSHVMKWQGKLLVVGSRQSGGSHKAYVLDMCTLTWTNVESMEEFSGHVQEGCYLEI